MKTTLSNAKLKDGKVVTTKTKKSKKKDELKEVDAETLTDSSKDFTLHVNNRYLIKSDGSCITVYQRTRSEKGEVNVKVVGYFSNLVQAMNRVLEEKIADLTAVKLDELKGYLFSIQQDLKNAIAELT